MTMLEYYVDGANVLCHAAKDGSMEALDIMAKAIATSEQIPQNAVLVPVPQHTGRAGYTRILAEKISLITGAEVYDVLACKPHDSTYEAKKKGIEPDFSFFLTGNIPSGRPVYLVDNVISTGRTFHEARKVLGERLIPLVYAVDSTRLEERYHVFELKDKDGVIGADDEDSFIDFLEYMEEAIQNAKNKST